jgi:hypothetical protein
VSGEAPSEADSRAEQKRRAREWLVFVSWWIVALVLLWPGISLALRHRRLFPPRASSEYLALPAFTKFAACASPMLLVLGCLSIGMLLASRRSLFCHRLTHSLPALVAMSLVGFAIIASTIRGLMPYMVLFELTPR